MCHLAAYGMPECVLSVKGTSKSGFRLIRELTLFCSLRLGVKTLKQFQDTEGHFRTGATAGSARWQHVAERDDGSCGSRADFVATGAIILGRLPVPPAAGPVAPAPVASSSSVPPPSTAPPLEPEQRAELHTDAQLRVNMVANLAGMATNLLVPG